MAAALARLSTIWLPIEVHAHSTTFLRQPRRDNNLYTQKRNIYYSPVMFPAPNCSPITSIESL